MSRDIHVHIAAAHPGANGEVFLRVHVPAPASVDTTEVDWIGTATLTIPEGPR